MWNKENIYGEEIGYWEYLDFYGNKHTGYYDHGYKVGVWRERGYDNLYFCLHHKQLDWMVSYSIPMVAYIDSYIYIHIVYLE